MHPLYASAIEITDKSKDMRLRVADLSLELSQAEYSLHVTKAKVERALIKQVKGEKALGPTVEDRARIFVLALDADKDFQTQLNRRNEAELKLEQAKAELSSLQERLRVMLAVMNTGGENDTTAT